LKNNSKNFAKILDLKIKKKKGGGI